MWRRLRWVAALGLLVLVLYLLRPALPPSAAAPAPPAASPPEVTLHDFRLIETRAGATLWAVRADRAEVHEQAGYTILSRITRPVEVTLYSSQGRLDCTANLVRVDLRTKDVRLEGAVLARSDQGAELQTEMLRWIAATRQLRTDQPVTLTRGGLTTRGRGLEAETTLERLRILQDITSQVRPADVAPALGGGAVHP